jgi:hypothetical protein
VYNTIDSDPVLRNCILWANLGDADGDSGGPFTDESAQIDDDGTGTVTVGYSLVQGWTGALGGTGNIDGDPLFVDVDGADEVAGTEDDDLRLLPGSPCIDAGNDTVVPPDTTDLDGDFDTAERIPLDRAGMPRFLDDPDTVDTGVADPPSYTAVVDMGAYEYFPDCNRNDLPDECDRNCSALNGDCDLLGCGQSADCNTNEIPDECDIADCVAYPDCDDCNLNGVPDSCDIAGGASLDVNPVDGVPDGCIGPSTSGPNWTDDIWGLSGGYPDNVDSVPGLDVTLDAVDIFLDDTVEIESLRLLNGARLRVTQTTVGDLIVVAEGGIYAEGQILVANDRVISVPNGPIVIGLNGQYKADPNATPGTVSASLIAQRVSLLPVIPNDPNPAESEQMTLSDAMTASITGDFVMDGRDAELLPPFGGRTSSLVGGRTPPILSVCSTPPAGSVAAAEAGVAMAAPLAPLSIGGSFTMQRAAVVRIECEPGSTGTSPSVSIGGDFNNQSYYPSVFRWNDGHLILTGEGMHMFEIGSLNVGVAAEGFATDQDTLYDTAPHTNFSVGEIEVTPGGSVTLVNDYTNTAGVEGNSEAVYIHDLVLNDGVNVVVDNCSVFYESVAGTATVTRIGSGDMVCMQTAAPPTGSGVDKNRYFSFIGGNAGQETALRVRLAGLPAPFNSYDDSVMWVGIPHQVCENSGQGITVDPQDLGACGPAPGLGQNWFWAAPLVCDPEDAHRMDWTTLAGYCNGGDLNAHTCTSDVDCPDGTCGVDDVVHLYDEQIVPSRMASSTGPIDALAAYDVQAVDGTCMLQQENAYSDPLAVIQAGWGDVVLSVVDCPNGPPEESVGVVTDVVAVLNKFSNSHCAPKKARTDLQPNNVDFKIDISEVVRCLGAFVGDPYPFGSGQCVDSLCSGGPDHGIPCTSDDDCSSDPCSSGQ